MPPFKYVEKKIVTDTPIPDAGWAVHKKVTLFMKWYAHVITTTFKTNGAKLSQTSQFHCKPDMYLSAKFVKDLPHFEKVYANGLMKLHDRKLWAKIDTLKMRK